jgi:hypothetical protein
MNHVSLGDIVTGIDIFVFSTIFGIVAGNRDKPLTQFIYIFLVIINFLNFFAD